MRLWYKISRKKEVPNGKDPWGETCSGRAGRQETGREGADEAAPARRQAWRQPYYAGLYKEGRPRGLFQAQAASPDHGRGDGPFFGVHLRTRAQDHILP